MTASGSSDIQAWLRQHYALPETLTVRPTARGVNNRSWLVAAGDTTFVLKRYGNVGMEQRLPFEYGLLAALTRTGTPVRGANTGAIDLR